MGKIYLDGYTGSIMASESILDGMTILHGPGGCRSFPMNLSTRRVAREHSMTEGEFFFHNARLPCTYVDSNDYIYGAAQKVSMILEILSSDDVRFATVIESPGAALIGDSLVDEVERSDVRDKALVVESSSISARFSVGFDSTLTKIVDKLTAGQISEHDPDTVNIIGLPFTQRGYEFVLQEMTQLLGMMGLRVRAAIGAGCTIDDIKGSMGSSYNIVVFPEYCKQLGEYYEQRGIPQIVSEKGVPVGFDAIRAWYSNIGEKTGHDPSKVLDIIDSEEKRYRRLLDNSYVTVQYAYYRTFSISAESSLVLPLMKWLVKECKSTPVSIEFTEEDEKSVSEVDSLLQKMDWTESKGVPVDSVYVDYLFGQGSYGRLRKMRRECLEYFDVNVPNKDFFDLAPKSVLGIQGCRMMMDRLFNAR